MKKGFIRFVGDLYATEFFNVKNIKDLRKKGREFLGVERLPRGCECWINENDFDYTC